MLNKLQQHLPNRTLKLSNAGDGGLITQILLGLAGIAAALVISYALFGMTQSILKDRKLIDNSITVPAASVDGECESKKFLSSCDIEISYKGQTIERGFTFVDFSSKDYNVEVLAQKDDPSNMNVDLALQKMTNRMLTAGGLLLLALGALIYGISVFRAIPKKQRLKKLMNAPENQPWEFVAVPATIDCDEVSYTTEVDGQPLELALNFQGRKPVLLNSDSDQKQVLGIKAKSQNTTVVLCSKLKNLDLTKTEKKPLLDIIKSA